MVARRYSLTSGNHPDLQYYFPIPIWLHFQIDALPKFNHEPMADLKHCSLHHEPFAKRDRFSTGKGSGDMMMQLESKRPTDVTNDVEDAITEFEKQAEGKFEELRSILFCNTGVAMAVVGKQGKWTYRTIRLFVSMCTIHAHITLLGVAVEFAQ
jgi:hypothetical protein